MVRVTINALDKKYSSYVSTVTMDKPAMTFGSLGSYDIVIPGTKQQLYALLYNDGTNTLSIRLCLQENDDSIKINSASLKKGEDTIIEHGDLISIRNTSYRVEIFEEDTLQSSNNNHMDLKASINSTPDITSNIYDVSMDIIDNNNNTNINDNGIVQESTSETQTITSMTSNLDESREELSSFIIDRQPDTETEESDQEEQEDNTNQDNDILETMQVDQRDSELKKVIEIKDIEPISLLDQSITLDDNNQNNNNINNNINNNNNNVSNSNGMKKVPKLPKKKKSITNQTPSLTPIKINVDVKYQKLMSCLNNLDKIPESLPETEFSKKIRNIIFKIHDSNKNKVFPYIIRTPKEEWFGHNKHLPYYKSLQVKGKPTQSNVRTLNIIESRLAKGEYNDDVDLVLDDLFLMLNNSFVYNGDEKFNRRKKIVEIIQIILKELTTIKYLTEDKYQVYSIKLDNLVDANQDLMNGNDDDLNGEREETIPTTSTTTTITLTNDEKEEVPTEKPLKKAKTTHVVEENRSRPPKRNPAKMVRYGEEEEPKYIDRNTEKLINKKKLDHQTYLSIKDREKLLPFIQTNLMIIDLIEGIPDPNDKDQGLTDHVHRLPSDESEAYAYDRVNKNPMSICIIRNKLIDNVYKEDVNLLLKDFKLMKENADRFYNVIDIPPTDRPMETCSIKILKKYIYLAFKNGILRQTDLKNIAEEDIPKELKIYTLTGKRKDKELN